MASTIEIVRVLPAGSVRKITNGDVATYFAHTDSPLYRRQFDTEEEAVAHLRAVQAGTAEENL